MQQPGTSSKTRTLVISVAAVALVVAVGAAVWFEPWQPEEEPWTSQYPVDGDSRNWSRTGVKMGRINLQLKIPTRWETQVIEEKDLNLQGFVTSSEQLQWEFARQLDGTISPLVLVAKDSDEVAHFRVFKLYKHISSGIDEAAIQWMQDRGVQYVIDRYTGTADYHETRGPIEEGTLGSGEKMTMIPSALEFNEEIKHVWTVFVLRPNSTTALYEYIVFFFHNGSNTREIDKNLLLEITNFATKMF
jgi:hypothetical protein